MDSDVMSQMNLGRIGLGTFPFAGVFSAVDEDSATGIVETFLDCGGRYIETAPSYPRKIDLGRILARFPRERYAIASKCVTATAPDGSKQRTGRYAAIIEQCENEIHRLGCDYLDVLQAHITPEDVHPSETMEALEHLRKRGLVTWIGVSNVSLEQLEAFAEGGRVNLVQNRLSLVHRRAYEPLLEYCRRNEISFNVYQVIERGQLTDKPRSDEELTPSDLRRTKVEYTGNTYAVIRQWFVDRIQPLAAELGSSAESLAISWVLHQPMVALGVVGATNRAQVERNIAAAKLHLSPQILQRIEDAYRILEAELREQYGLNVEEFRGLAA